MFSLAVVVCAVVVACRDTRDDLVRDHTSTSRHAVHNACIECFFDVGFFGKSLAIPVDLPFLAVFGLAGVVKTGLLSGGDVMERSRQLNALRFGFEWHQGCADFRQAETSLAAFKCCACLRGGRVCGLHLDSADGG